MTINNYRADVILYIDEEIKALDEADAKEALQEYMLEELVSFDIQKIEINNIREIK